MKLAEALLLRSDQQKKLASLKQRINANVLIQDGDEPSEDPNELIKQVFALSQESNQLISRIHLTNALARLEDGKILLSLLSSRDSYAEQHNILINAIANTHREPDRYSAREIKWQKVIPVSSLQKQADDISAKLRDINIKIQAVNWHIDLVE
ncbi:MULTISPECIES: DIP1984 family protein [Acinetobacter]|uniref:Septicolysin n=1 Tax=Acinetobacter junii TaxID=40215 RepID=A0A365PJB9_ACIJU|nr:MULTISPECIES: DIP1984 family protein [Acinetobacter]RBA32506.1 septicolysin [Acinetobacter junii]RBA42534.1 septicolysin [Acinetobacter junii]RBA48281.1 septicolysin [Acinetobacter junii]WLF73837.1 DIP1984 family protein [Acinetobacter junii]